MTKPTITQSQKRSLDTLSSLFSLTNPEKADFIFLKSSSDVGVERNGGRNGAAYAPHSFLSYFKKLNKKAALEGKIFFEAEVANRILERENFHDSQKEEARQIGKVISAAPKAFLCHLGGGHDHVYPLLVALGEKHKKIVVINIDAHADTRTDSDFHSGTPFRQFSTDESCDFHLFQIGLLEFANSASTLSPLPKNQAHILWRHELEDKAKITEFFKKIQKEIDQETMVVFSLDADALAGTEVPGVSAVNGHGLSRNELTHLWSNYRKLNFSHSPVIGIYELNPVYDTLSMVSMRTLGTFLFESL